MSLDPPDAQLPAAAPTGPFQRATHSRRRLKLLLWGDSGSGKTTLALRFPGVVMIDMEDGTAHYGGVYQFDVLKATTCDEASEAVDWLRTRPHPYLTLVIDPITIYWEALQAKWGQIFLQRNKGGKGHRGDYYELQPRDWVTLKAELKEFLRKLIALDMNVIVTARQKAQYADGAFMRVIGETFDGEKSLPYLFDTILRLYRDETGRFMAENIKDRSDKLPRGHFAVSYDVFASSFGSEALDRPPEPVALVTAEQIEKIRHLLSAFGIGEGKLRERLAAYGATTIEGLTEANAELIIGKLTAAATAKAATTTSQ